MEQQFTVRQSNDKGRGTQTCQVKQRLFQSGLRLRRISSRTEYPGLVTTYKRSPSALRTERWAKESELQFFSQSRRSRELRTAINSIRGAVGTYSEAGVSLAASGSRLAVVGSRPEADLRDKRLTRADILIGVNAAVGRPTRTPDIAVLDYRHLRPPVSELTAAGQKLLHGKELSTVVAIQSNLSENSIEQDFLFTYKHLVKLGINARSQIVRQATRVPNFPVTLDFMPSTGVIAACLAVLLGASNIHLHGFSLYSSEPRTLHYYESIPPALNAHFPRNHSRADAAVLALLSRRTDMTSDSWEIDALLKNWN